jgi:hypothetical protein
MDPFAGARGREGGRRAPAYAPGGVARRPARTPASRPVRTPASRPAVAGEGAA